MFYGEKTTCRLFYWFKNKYIIKDAGMIVGFSFLFDIFPVVSRSNSKATAATDDHTTVLVFLIPICCLSMKSYKSLEELRKHYYKMASLFGEDNLVCWGQIYHIFVRLPYTF